MYRNLGLDLSGCAKLLHVTERTLHNWESGKHDIPYATFKLLRLLNGMELPGESWRGWSFRGDKLRSPEGHLIAGTDGAWWSLLVRQARYFGPLQARIAKLETQLAAATAGQACAARAGAEGAPLAGEVSAPCACMTSQAANQSNFQPSPLVITGRTNSAPFFSYCEIAPGGRHG